ncbi:shikimate dehydrogenase [Actinokineospora bangkokensis]|uniref:Shikimate dehydrogenase n=1 Tax=Actinokineospora bangkokensis TaxID=1193682 RepID=A0A1Q9LI57_9PSEU|nr:shikimate dehydrogenase [Actinokineospora bangkokensis]OLR91706.1 shikimate dehydrogenase [Actinokineospora bangkokensis]
MPATRRAAVLGSPVAHSLSPVLHGAAYRELGLGWSYDRVECDAAALPALVDSLGPEWAGLSVTMPGKRAALRTAHTATERAVAVGAANTLVHRADGTWHADCTDVDGVTGALLVAAGYHPVPGDQALVLGAGGTACAALAAFAALGVSSAVLVVRDRTRAEEAEDCADRLSLPVEVVEWADADFTGLAGSTAVLVNTAPTQAAEPIAAQLATARHVLDVVYHPWPTPLAEATRRSGARLATGLDMLLHQAFGQVEQFTGQSAPRVAMRDALAAAVPDPVPLPL